MQKLGSSLLRHACIQFQMQSSLKLCQYSSSTSSSDKQQQQPHSNKTSKGTMIRRSSPTALEKSNKLLKDIARSNFEDPSASNSVEERIKKMNPMNVYRNMDTSMEGFFNKRQYNVKNFNFLLQALAEKRDLQAAQNVLALMNEMKFTPDSYTYNCMIKVCSKSRRMDLAEEYFEKANQLFGINQHNYNSLLLGYARSQNIAECNRIVREMEEKGLQLDSSTYTTLINANYKSRNLAKCWQIFKNLDKTKPNLVDIPMISFMIEIASHTREAEQGKVLWKRLDKMPSFYPNTIHFNNIIKCLGSRKDYADEAIDEYVRMKELGVQPDEDTFVALFKACSNAGDVKTAFDALQVMKLNNIPMNRYILTAAIKVYGGVVKSEYMTNDLIDIYIKDAWKLFEKAAQENMVDVHVVNALLEVHVKALREDEIDGLILPLFTKYDLKRTGETYELLMEVYHERRNLPNIYKLHGWLKSEGIQESWKILNYLFDAAYRAEDVKIMCETLDKFIAAKKEPRLIFLKRLGENKNTPDELYIRLLKFENRFGYVKDKNYKPIASVKSQLKGIAGRGELQK